MKPYEETHQQGFLSIEKVVTESIKDCDFGVQIAEDGRVWICIDGIAFLRFSPKRKEYVKREKSLRVRRGGHLAGMPE